MLHGKFYLQNVGINPPYCYITDYMITKQIAMLTRIILSSLLFALLIPPVSVIANEKAADDLFKMSFEQLLETEVITASKIAQQLTDAPSAVTIVTSQDIEDYGYRTFAEILESMRGLYVSDDRAYAFLGGRGYGKPGDFTGRILLVIDGTQVNDNIYDSVFIDNAGPIDVALIDRIEYVSGPGTSVNTNNAFYGIINVYTKSGADFDSLQLSGDISSYSTKSGRGTYGKQLDGGQELLVSVSGLNSDGQSHYFQEIDDTSYNLDGQSNERLFAKLNWDKGLAEAIYRSRNKDIPTAPYGGDFGAPSNYTDTSFNFSAQQHFDLNQNLKLSLNAYYGYYNYEGLETFSSMPWLESSTGQWFGLNTHFFDSSFKFHKLVYGFEYRNDFEQKLTTPASLSNNDEQSVSAYLQDEYQFSDRITLSGGLRWSYNSDVGHSETSPRLAVIYSPFDRTQFKLSYSKAYRNANPFEKYYTDNDVLLDNLNLGSEEIEAFELVAEHRLLNNAHILSSFYQYKTKDFISSVDVGGGITQFQNTSGSTTQGIELEYERQWDTGLRLRTSYAFQHAMDANDNRQTNAPRHIGKMNVTTPVLNGNWHLGYELQAYSDRLTEHRTTIGSYSTSNLTLRSNRLLPNFSITMGIRNLFDRDYAHVAPPVNTYQIVIPQNRRNYFLQLVYDLK